MHVQKAYINMIWENKHHGIKKALGLYLCLLQCTLYGIVYM
jgi:hypothetical protein